MAFDNAHALVIGVGSRITSYNVCYTKLLRFHFRIVEVGDAHLLQADDFVEFIKNGGNGFWCAQIIPRSKRVV